MKRFSIIILLTLVHFNLNAQQNVDILDLKNLDFNGLTVTQTTFKNKECIQAYLDNDSNTELFIGIPDVKFTNGTIELEISGMPKKYSNPMAKGFVGIAFRTQNDSTYECIYLRPVNSIDTDQLYRNSTVQYTSHPDYPWQRQNSESPGKYETYCPIKPGDWIKVKIVVEGNQAILYVNNAPEPSFFVNDLKLGSDISGGIGLWVGSWTLAHFCNLTILHN